MYSENITEAIELHCFKVIGDNGETIYVVAPSMQDAITYFEEVQGVKSCEYMGVGAVGDVK